MADILAEVDEAMRHERIEQLWKDHGKTILLALGMIILGTAIGSAWRHWNDSVRIKQTDAVYELIDAKEFPANIKDAKIDLRGGPRGLVLLTAAGAFMDDKKIEDALAMYERAAADKGIPDDLRHLAILSVVRLKKDAPEAEDLLKSVWNDSNSPWRYHGHLDAAVFYAAKNDLKTAREHLAEIAKAQNLPESLYSKAKALDHVYALRQQQTETPKEAS